MSTKHTPLPWEVIGTGYQLQIVDSNGAMICEGFSWSDQCKANARLIVRACNSHHELLAALEEMAMSYMSFTGRKPENAIAAIAKARGETL